MRRFQIGWAGSSPSSMRRSLKPAIGPPRAGSFGTGGNAKPSSLKPRGREPRRRDTRGGNFTNPCFSKRSKATLAELTLERPLASRQCTARQNSAVTFTRLGASGPWDRRVIRSRTLCSIQRPQILMAPITTSGYYLRRLCQEAIFSGKGEGKGGSPPRRFANRSETPRMVHPPTFTRRISCLAA